METKSIYLKIVELQWEAVEISKTGINDYSKYQYKKFIDIKKAIMLKMSELKLAILPFGEIKNFNINGIVQYIQPMAIIDGESGEKHCFEFPFIGKNTDPDKASGAAITYALKYVLNLIALLPDESLDPDTTENSKQNSVKAVNPQPNFNKQIQEIIKNDDEAKATLKIILNFKDIKSLNELSDKEKQEFIKKWGTN